MDVHFGVGDVVVSDDEQVGSFLFQGVGPDQHVLEEAHFHGLSYIAGGAAGEITVEDGQIAQVGAEHPAFAIIFVDTHA